jgi:hypothetical protein
MDFDLQGNIPARATRQATHGRCGLGPCPRHGNSLVCEKDAEYVQMMWRSSFIRYSPAATLGVHHYGRGVRIFERARRAVLS